MILFVYKNFELRNIVLRTRQLSRSPSSTLAEARALVAPPVPFARFRHDGSFSARAVWSGLALQGTMVNAGLAVLLLTMHMAILGRPIGGASTFKCRWDWRQPSYQRLQGAIGCPWQTCEAAFARAYPALEAELGPRPRGQPRGGNTRKAAWVGATAGLPGERRGPKDRPRRRPKSPCPVCPPHTAEQHGEQPLSMDNVLVILILGGRFAGHEFENILRSWGRHVRHGVVLTNTPETLGSVPGPAWETLPAPVNTLGCRSLWIMLLAVAEARMRANPRIKWVLRSDADTWWNVHAMLNQLNTLPAHMRGADPTVIGQQFGLPAEGAAVRFRSRFRPQHPVHERHHLGFGALYRVLSGRTSVPSLFMRRAGTLCNPLPFGCAQLAHHPVSMHSGINEHTHTHARAHTHPRARMSDTAT